MKQKIKISEKPRDIYGQYAYDRVRDLVPDGLAEAAQEEAGVFTRGNGDMAFHTEDVLFDAADGSPDIDPATGRRVGEANALGRLGLEAEDTYIEPLLAKGEPDTSYPDQLNEYGEPKPQKPEVDPADEWMKANGFTWEE